MKRTAAVVVAIIMLAGLGTVRYTSADERHRNQLTFSDDTGVQRTMTTADSFDFDNPFFQDLAPTDAAA